MRIPTAVIISFSKIYCTPDSHAQSRRTKPAHATALLEYPVWRPPEAQWYRTAHCCDAVVIIRPMSDPEFRASGAERLLSEPSMIKAKDEGRITLRMLLYVIRTGCHRPDHLPVRRELWFTLGHGRHAALATAGLLRLRMHVRRLVPRLEPPVEDGRREVLP